MADQRFGKVRTRAHDLDGTADVLRLLPGHSKKFGGTEQGGDESHHVLPGTIRDVSFTKNGRQLGSLVVEVSKR